MTQPSSAPGGDSRLALTAGAGCYLVWGVIPLLFQAIGRHGAGGWETLAQRTIWGVPVAALFVTLAHQWPQIASVLRRPKVLALLCVSAVLIAINWLTYIWAVTHGRVLESSLGYYINPLLNMALGALLFRERIGRIGLAAIALAVVGVGLQTAALGHLPVLSVFLAVSFAAYGLLRRKVDADAQTGLMVECTLLAIPGLAYIAWLESQGAGHFLGDPAAAGLLMLSGVATAVPLMLFSWAARRLPFSILGFLQFIAPTMTFFIGVAQGEAFTPLRAASFGFIWAGAAVFTYGMWRRARILPRQAA